MAIDPYRHLLRPLLFSGLQADPEFLHQQFISLCGWLNQDRSLGTWLRQQLQQRYALSDPRLERQVWGLRFPNPIGLAAGFDKNGVARSVWSAFGFGFAELGTVTWHPQPGNPRPRLFRLGADRAVINRMGFNNAGAEAMAASLERSPPPNIPIGINLGKSKITPLEAAKEDYLASFRRLHPLGDYFVINVSSPNTPGLRDLQAKEQLEPILETLQTANHPRKPLLLKIAPDLSWEQIAAILDLLQAYELAGIVATNTTVAREGLKSQTIPQTGRSPAAEAGGLSGAPLRDRATAVIRFIHKQTQGTLPIIGVGGIFTPEDVIEKLAAGATLVQLYTGWIYQGPSLLRELLKGLLAHAADPEKPEK
ncbi:FMN-dependent dihydroorotate dehydrogenase PyrD [Thermosynechococcus sp. NK55a]|jgi:dihydroorotate dehydrogenase|uniref:quinone-dependent dihydroorotate dehydrogenase n=1 Tax=unclassified Thermosynechococcus TaxID=2622553 RepID=UPI0003D9365B|nr:MULTISPECIES: quinone-dependent dihydroorotate dehydrogenase [unclassified Thermosynechococcus]AHB89604.1 FMN-dependent dihydroorotate dehydrogenase PyrD [Thermosynechococcus sp. NK55a]HIK22935.1 quinone-dependent dihydroorotate dehydrogenase [Thermosynechococcus sp. M3746_W2019_013]